MTVLEHGRRASPCRRALGAFLVLSSLTACAEETRPPYRPRVKDDGGPRIDRDDAGQGAGGSMGLPPTERPTGEALAAMVEELSAIGADVDDPDRVCAGWAHACGIDVEGKVHCFGGNAFGQSTPPSMQTKQVQVGCGINSSCALDEAGAITCWGAGTDPTLIDQQHQMQSIPPKGTFTQLAMGPGAFHVCAIAQGGTVECWGGGSFDKPATAVGNFRQAVAPKGAFVKLAVGEAHTCGIMDTGEIACWGGGGEGCLGPPLGYACGQTTPPMGTFVDVAAGEFHSCGLRDDGTATCWGAGLSSEPCAPDSALFECGQGLIPADIAPIKRIRAGNLHTCAITEDYEAVCWGWASAGQTTVPKLYSFSQVAGGDQFSCGWSTGSTVECWGTVPATVPEALRLPP